VGVRKCLPFRRRVTPEIFDTLNKKYNILMHSLAPITGIAGVFIKTSKHWGLKTVGRGYRMRTQGPIIEAEDRERGGILGEGAVSPLPKNHTPLSAFGLDFPLPSRGRRGDIFSHPLTPCPPTKCGCQIGDAVFSPTPATLHCMHGSGYETANNFTWHEV